MVTLIIGCTFLISFVALDSMKTITVSEELDSEGNVISTTYSESLDNLQSKYIIATVVLLLVSIAESILIIRFFK